MAYFSNGTEGDIFRESNCDKCVHDLRSGCRIWLLHLTRNYEQTQGTPEGKEIKFILNELIPQDEDGFARRCSMFHPFTEDEEHESKVDRMRSNGRDKPAPWIQEWMTKSKTP